MKIEKLLIANRGEIACRIAATAAKMGIRTYGIFTPQDRLSRHVRLLDEAIQLPSGDLVENYLNQERILQIALNHSVHAIHPGYGFLAENPDFAESILSAGLVWVGPNPAAMRKLGGKINAKGIAEGAQVPVAPWIRISEELDQPEIEHILKTIELPILIKAAHGGGGRGQRVVRKASDFLEALRAARSESLRSFGSPEVFAERFLDEPRHIEVQIMADQHGNIAALGERDCTLQRRNQKIVEESPAAVLDEATRTKIHHAAGTLAAAAGYTNAGTIEFLAQKGKDGKWEFYFMELNARLQVEHPVTELLWNVDLVELQILAAQGENLKDRFDSLSASGEHAIELRLCAENPHNNFLPTPGPIIEMQFPEKSDLRIDSGFEEGDVVPQEYDSLFAKLIFKAATREEAVSGMANVLDQTLISGLITNKFFLRSILAHPDFRNNITSTHWIDSHPELRKTEESPLETDLAYWGKKLSSDLLVRRTSGNGLTTRLPTQLLTGFIPLDGVHGEISLQGKIRVAGDFRLADGNSVYASGWISRFELCITFKPDILGNGQKRIAFAGQYEVDDLRHHHGPIIAQVPGVVLDVRAKAEDTIEATEPILVVEAMKIEMPMSLPIAAKITEIHVKPGDRILPGQTLVTWEPQT